jgi:hypothetical protein
MKGNILRKIIVVLIITAPLISYTGCRKQAKCGCGKDVLKTFTITSANIYFNSTYSLLYFNTLGDIYSQYNFCNPSEIIPKLADVKSGDILQVSGHVYWNCNYISQVSNSSYQSLYRIYDVQVTDISVDLYGKTKPVSGTPIDSANTKN